MSAANTSEAQMSFQPDFWNLPWQLQVIAASGYAAYALAYHGIRSQDSTRDVLFRALVFSLFTTASLELSSRLVPIASAAIAVIMTLAAAIIWRMWGMAKFAQFARAVGIRSDQSPSAFHKVALANDRVVSQLSVELDNGDWLHCDSTSKFANAPHDSCTFGSNGDLAMYVTHRSDLGKNRQEVPSTEFVDAWGTQLTYIPAARIRCMTIRYI